MVNKPIVYPRGKDKYHYLNIVIVPKWKKDETEFPVTVSHHETRGFQAYIPKPIMDILENPEAIKFIVKGKKIEVKAHK